MKTVQNITRESWILDVFPEWGSWLNEEIENTQVAENTFAMWWLGCTGIYLKTPGNANLTVDYWVGRGKASQYEPKQGPDQQMNRMCGSVNLNPNLRNIPCVLDPFLIKDLDAVLSTHFHGDHIDIYVAAAILQNCPDAKFIGPQLSADKWIAWGVPQDRITVVKPGDKITIKDTIIHVVESFDRTALVTTPPVGPLDGIIPDMDERAVNFVFETPGGTLYHSGDSHFSNYYRKHGLDYNIDVALGSFGENPPGITDKMTACDILRMAENLMCKVVIPIHHDLWTNQHGDTSNIDLLYENNKYRMQYQFKPFIWEVGGKFVFPDDKDKRRYLYRRGMEDAFTNDPRLPFLSFL